MLSCFLFLQYMRTLGPFFDNIDSEFSNLRNTARDVLQQEKDLSEIVQLVGRDSLSEDQKVCPTPPTFPRA